jgi:VCBS repeat-containing protein
MRGLLRLSSALFIAALGTGSAYAQNVNFVFSPGSATIDCGQTLTVDVEIDGTITDLRGYSLVLTYDNAIFEPVSATPGALIAGAACGNSFFWTNSGSNDGTVRVDLGLLGCSVNGAGSVLTVQFQGLTSGATPRVSALSLSGIMRNSLNQDISFAATPTSMTSICNAAPTGNDDAYATDEDTPRNVAAPGVLANDTDPDLDPLTVNTTPVSGPTHGLLVLNADGSFTYTPNANFNGVDSFDYEVTDGDKTDVATVTITVNAVNDAPVAVDEAYATDEDTPLNVAAPGVLGNDVDVELDALSAVLVAGPASGLLALNPDGSFLYTPAGNFNGLATFTYRASDGSLTSNVATVTITVNAVNDAPVVATPADQANVERDVVSLQIVASDPDLDDLTYAATNLPPGTSINANTGLIDGQIDCSASLGSPYVVTVTVTDDGTPNLQTQVLFHWDVTPLPIPAAVADLAASQVKTGNGVAHTTGITLAYSGVGPGHTVAVYRKGFGDYPEYDDGTGAPPAAPATPAAALADGWVLTSVASSGDTDTPASRDFWYYAAFVMNECGGTSAVSNLTGGALNYHLGDVSDGITPGQGDNTVDAADISALGAAYGTVDGNVNYRNFLDVGPTTDFSIDARPTTDNQIQFEDLVLFAINFGTVSKAHLAAGGGSGHHLVLRLPEALPAVGATIEVSLELATSGGLQAISVPLAWNSAAVEYVGFAPGSLVEPGGGDAVLLSARPGTLDAAALGRTLAGNGTLATVTFRVTESSDPGFAFGDVIGRNPRNEPIVVEQEIVVGQPVATNDLPARTQLHPNAPNPFFDQTRISFALAREGRVALKIYSVAGRLIRTLLDERMQPGDYTLHWDGRDNAGVPVSVGMYLMRFVTPDRAETQRLLRIR